ncbi:MAG TPA: histidine phosphatase family protein [Gaiellaceae bacterium]|nr:histidine phosphatase family protein [Gaiellaceae bacterium]
MRVFLVRHAEAAPGEPDALRPLTSAGRDAARALGDTLAREQLDAVVSSPLRRARETAEEVAAAAGLAAEPHEGLGPGATLASLRDAVAGRGATVAAIGHQPDCGDIVEELTGERRPFAPGTYAELEL